VRVSVDLSKCQGYANCVAAAPGVFDLDEDTLRSVVVLDPVPTALEADARRAEAACPAHAISVED
jgi:ferredoxin